jgi:hypothetical protein
LNKGGGINVCSTSTDKLLSMSATEDDVVVSSGPDAQIVQRAGAAAQIGYAIDRVEQASHTWRVINGSLRRAGIGTDLLAGETWRGSSGSEIILKRHRQNPRRQLTVDHAPGSAKIIFTHAND